MATVASHRSGAHAASRGGRYVRRLLAAGLYAGAVVVAWVILSPVLPSVRFWSSPSQPAAIERPAAAPARVPAWAWRLHEWHQAPRSSRGPRPAEAPRAVPGWYWDWHEWRLQAGS